jgi:hypothetical protein
MEDEIGGPCRMHYMKNVSAFIVGKTEGKRTTEFLDQRASIGSSTRTVLVRVHFNANFLAIYAVIIYDKSVF